MKRTKGRSWSVTCIAVMLFTGLLATAATAAQEANNTQPSPQGRRRGASGVYKAAVVPHWYANHQRFWYRNDLRGGRREFIAVDVLTATRSPAFDHARLAAGLAEATETKVAGDQLPFTAIEFVDEGKGLLFEVDDKTWRCDLASYAVAPSDVALIARDRNRSNASQSRGRRFGRGRGRGIGRTSVDSPDGRWTAMLRENNIFAKPKDTSQSEVQLTDDGTDSFPYGMLEWSPNSKHLVAFRIDSGDRHEVHLVESSPQDGGRAKLSSRPYALPGDKFTAYELHVFDVENGKHVRPDVDRVDFGRPRLRWINDGQRFTYEKNDRGHQRFRMVEVDASSGAARTIIDESTDTFIWTAHTEIVGMRLIYYLEMSDELIYVSERDGWRQLYLIDAESGEIKNPITQGEFVVRGIEQIDEENRQVWFRACGMNADQDPYFIHYYRVNFDGTGLVALTAGNGTHSVQFSPDREYLVDTYSRVDQAPIHELRRTSDGQLVCEFDRADISQLLENGWAPPEVFVAKGRDGKTDIWGLIYQPRDIDPDAQYPVIEDIYAGPHGSFVPKSFSASQRYSSLTELGFVVVKMDGMGTANRSKAFHDVCWHNLKDSGFPDRILWMKAAAKTHAHLDLDRVGIYGTSAGGQSAAAALLFHPEFYKVAVSACGCHDNRMDKASWNEQWMGYPVGPHYAECSNIDNAHRLEGKLLLIVGEMDTNVPPESTMRLVDALIKADKDFELIVIPGAGHTSGGRYGERRRQRFFVQHLLGGDRK